MEREEDRVGGQTAPFNASLPLPSAPQPTGSLSSAGWTGRDPPPLRSSPLWTYSCDVKLLEVKDLGPPVHTLLGPQPWPSRSFHCPSPRHPGMGPACRTFIRCKGPALDI